MPSRPGFAESFPRDPTLDALVDAFSAGNYRRVREEAPRLAESTDDPLVRAAARDLRARIEPDPWALVLLGLTLALLVFLSVFWRLHDGHDAESIPAPSPPSAPVEHVR